MLLSSYCDVKFVVDLLRCNDFHRLITFNALFVWERFKQVKRIRSVKYSEYGRQYVGELEL